MALGFTRYFAPATPRDRLLAYDSVEPAIKQKAKGAVQQPRSCAAAAGDTNGPADLERARGPRRGCSNSASGRIRMLPSSSRASRRHGRKMKYVQRTESNPMQPNAKHWWRSRVVPFADAWPLMEGWLIGEPSVPANVLMDCLAAMLPEGYTSQVQLRALQHRIKAWRTDRVKAGPFLLAGVSGSPLAEIALTRPEKGDRSPFHAHIPPAFTCIRR